VTEPSHAVFLSYASQDAEAAQKICEALRAAGIEVFLDQSELRGGDVWDQKIRHEIHDCALFMPLISQHSQERLEGYFRLEWKLAVDRSHRMAAERSFVVPVVVDSTRERDALVPESFRDVQWTHLPGGQTSPAFVARVAALLGAPAPVATAAGPGPAPVSLRPAGTRDRRAVWIPLGLAALAIMVGSAWFALQHSDLHWHAEAGATGQSQPAVTEKSIAVLPFADLSEKHDQEYFADGMAEEILNLLVKVPDLKVIGRTSSFRFKGKTGDLREIGTVLGAAYVVEGSVRRSGDQIRIAAQLIDTRDGTHRWSETYDREASDSLKVQDEIAASLVRALELEVASAGFLKGRVLPRSGEAYDTYLRGLHAFNRFDQQGFEEAVTDFRRTLQLDPSFLPAAEQLARTLCDQPSWGFVAPRVGYEQARVAANEALKLNPNSASGHAALGCVHIWYDWDWPAALQEVNTAMALSPNDPFVLVTAAGQRQAIGQWSESLSLCDAGLSTDPLLATLYQNVGWGYVYLGRFAEAERAMRRVLDISPTYGTAHHDLAVILLMEGRPQDALSEIQKETLVGGRAAGLVLVYQALHRNKEAEAELTQLEGEHAAAMAMWIAEAHAFRGQKDQAFIWLDRAYAQKDIWLWTIKGDPLLKSLRAEPRYKAFLRKMNLPE
jgi:TolB-like protein/Flp pilus assembly protein TadD